MAILLQPGTTRKPALPQHATVSVVHTKLADASSYDQALQHFALIWITSACTLVVTWLGYLLLLFLPTTSFDFENGKVHT